MNTIIEISKALSNKTRVQILQWLKNPEKHFPPHTEVNGFEQGVCLVFIKEKSKLSQSTISQYMAQLEKTGLVRATRIGKWTYFKRNEEAILNFGKYIQDL